MFILNESLAFLLNKTGAAVASAFSQELKEYKITLQMWRVLAALWANGDQSLSGLADATSVEISTLSRQVAALNDRNFVTRRQSGVNWRSINISLTPSGRAIVERFLPQAERHERAALTGISDADIRRLKRLLSTIYANLIALDEVLPLGPEE